MKYIDSWVMGIIVSVFGLIGLFMAAYSSDGFFGAVGWMITIFSIIFVFSEINRVHK